MSQSFGIPNLPGYRQSRIQNPHGRRVPLPPGQQQPQPKPRSASPMTATQPAGWRNGVGEKKEVVAPPGTGWSDVDFSPLNSPAGNGWARPASDHDSNRQDSSEQRIKPCGSPIGAGHTADFDMHAKAFRHRADPAAKPHSAGERPHSYYGHPSTIKTEPDFSVCMHDALKFKCYFLEEPDGWNSPTGKEKTPHLRKFYLSYYHYDQSIDIHEMDYGSTEPQSTWLKRTQVYHIDAFGRKSLFKPDDFKVRGTFTVNNQEFTIVDAEPRTRKWYMETRGETLPASIPFPYDDKAPPRFRVDEKTGVLVDPQGRPISPKNGGLGGFGRDDIRRKNQGKKPRNPDDTPRPVPILLRDETVLRFYAILADKNSKAEGHFKGNEVQEAPFTFHYFVCDDTVEVAVTAKQGMGPRLLSRQILPKDSHAVPYNDHFTSKKGYEGKLVHWKDLYCGATIDVYGRPILLLSADRQTTEWYAARGITLKPWHDTRFDAKEKPRSSRVPAYHGFGDPNMQDEYALGLALEPKEGSGIVGRKGVNPSVPPKDKGVDSCTGEGATMRFIAQRLDIKTGEFIDQEYTEKREFVIRYFLDDDEISIHEPPVRNSGVRGGLFLNKMKYKRHVPCPGISMPGAHNLSPLSRWIKPIDLSPGNDITIEYPSTGMPLHRFLIVDCDSFTAAVLDEGGVPTPASAARCAYLANQREAQGLSPRPAGIGGRLALVMPKLSELLEAKAVDPRHCFKQLPDSRLGSGLVYEREFRCMVRNGFYPKEGGASISTEHILTEDDISLFVYSFNVQQDSDKGAIVDFGSFLDAMKLYHTDPPDLADHIKWNKRNAGREPLPPSLLKDSKLTNGFSRPKSACAEASMENNDIVEKVFKQLRLKMLQLKAHDPIDGCLLRKTFRSLDVGHRGLVSLHQWYKVIKLHNFQDLLSRETADILILKYAPYTGSSGRGRRGSVSGGQSPTPDTSMDYNDLCDAIHNVDFDAVMKKLVKMAKPIPKAERHLQEIPKSIYPGGHRVNEIEESWERLTSRSTDTKEEEEKENIEAHLHLSDLDDNSLLECMQTFASSFARPQRKSNLRKHCLAYDTSRRGQLSRKWLAAAVTTAVRECSIDGYNQPSTTRMLDFFFPKPDSNKVIYEDFLTIVFSRDVEKAKAMRITNLGHAVKQAWN